MYLNKAHVHTQIFLHLVGVTKTAAKRIPNVDTGAKFTECRARSIVEGQQKVKEKRLQQLVKGRPLQHLSTVANGTMNQPINQRVLVGSQQICMMGLTIFSVLHTGSV
jgi:hypothetical protein